MSERKYLPLFVGDYLADTRHLTLIEHGAYLMLLMLAWQSPGCRLPADEKKLMRMLNCTRREWNKLWPAVSDFFDIEEDEFGSFFVQKRLQKTNVFFNTRKARNQQNGAKGGRPKTLKNNDTGPKVGSVSVNPENNPEKTQKKPKPKAYKEKNIYSNSNTSNLPHARATETGREKNDPASRIVEEFIAAIDANWPGEAARLMSFAAYQTQANQVIDLGLDPDQIIEIIRTKAAFLAQQGYEPRRSITAFKNDFQKAAAEKNRRDRDALPGHVPGSGADRAAFLKRDALRMSLENQIELAEARENQPAAAANDHKIILGEQAERIIKDRKAAGFHQPQIPRHLQNPPMPEPDEIIV